MSSAITWEPAVEDPDHPWVVRWAKPPLEERFETRQLAEACLDGWLHALEGP